MKLTGTILTEAEERNAPEAEVVEATAFQAVIIGFESRQEY